MTASGPGPFEPVDLELLDAAMREAQAVAGDESTSDLDLCFALTHVVAFVGQMEEEIKALRARA